MSVTDLSTEEVTIDQISSNHKPSVKLIKRNPTPRSIRVKMVNEFEVSLDDLKKLI